MQFTQKETDLLKDLKGQEKLCVDKYARHASQASDKQLKDLFNQIGGIEQQHYDTLTQIESGTVPQVGGGQNQNKPSFNASYNKDETKEKKNDSFLCSDILATEKHASHLYDTCIFEFKDVNIRSVLNHIQKEEQDHGKLIYDYMQTNSMYS